MNHAYDLSPMLSEWTFDPTSVSARTVEADNGDIKIQLRLDLGVFQMEPEGRPDGKQPHGHATVLDYYRLRQLTERKNGTRLDGDACAELQQESVQFYYRYLAKLAIKDYEGVIADTQHNLDIFELVERDCENPDLVWEFLQFKPYVIMMNTRARAEKLAESGNIDDAVLSIQKGMQAIYTYLEESGEEIAPEACPELAMLAELSEDLRERGVPSEASKAVKLQEKLRYAIHNENYEEAAKLRDELKEIETSPVEAEALEQVESR